MKHFKLPIVVSTVAVAGLILASVAQDRGGPVAEAGDLDVTTKQPEASRAQSRMARPNLEGVSSATHAGGIEEELPPAPIEEPRFLERPESEWQGMRVNLAVELPCDADDECGMARACVEGRCTACTDDAQCSDGERCVLDHCVIDEFVECRGSAECSAGSTCILSGYTADPRGNGDMRSYCVNPID